MRQMPYQVFLWLFGASNAIVLILYGLGYFLQGQFAEAGRLDRHTAVKVLCLGLPLPVVLALQGSIVNLRAQFLAGPLADRYGRSS